MSTSEHIYFIQQQGGEYQVKIGTSTSVEDRRKGLQTANPYKLKTVLTLPGGHAEETLLHSKFGHLRGEGEWFDYRDELKHFIEESLTQQKNRRLSFRVYDLKTQEFSYLDRFHINFMEDTASVNEQGFRASYRVNHNKLVGRDVVLDQHTGAYDNFKRSIWENDVVWYIDNQNQSNGLVPISYAPAGYKAGTRNLIELVESKSLLIVCGTAYEPWDECVRKAKAVSAIARQALS